MERHNNALESISNSVPNSKISDLMNRMSKMSKSATIDSDLSQVLDEFLDRLRECDKYLENGIFNMNFAEAALLLQSSADLYGRKVDLLWDIIFDYQKRLLLSDDRSSDNGQEMEKLEERKRKYKRKRKQNADATVVTKLVDKFSYGTADTLDYLSQSCQQNNAVVEWEKFHVQASTYNGHMSSRNSVFLPNNSVHTEDNEYLGRYDQFHSASLVDDIFHLDATKLPGEEQDCVTNMRIDTHAVYDFLSQKSLPSDKLSESYAEELRQHISDFAKSHKQAKEAELSRCRNIFVQLDRLPSNLVRAKLRRTSCADSLLDDDNFSSISLECSSPRNSENVACGSCELPANLESRNKSCSQDSAFYELDELEELASTTPAPEPPDPTTFVAPPMGHVTDECDTPAVDKVTSPEKIAPPLNSNQLCSLVVVTRHKALKRSLIEFELEEPEIKKRKAQRPKRISEKTLQKLATGVTVAFRNFENFFRSQYKASENEGEVPPDLSESESEPEDDNDPDDDICFEETVSGQQEDLPAEEPEDLPAEEPEMSRLPEPEIPDILHPVSLAIRGVNLARQETPPSDADVEREETSHRNVREWRSFMLPKLKTMENRSDFDIHEYGANIIEQSAVGETRHFKDIVRGKGAAEVARYFIATLQLANTNNVEIFGGVPGEIANDSFQLKTLDKTRYHELLEDYQAPSEETFRERLERAKALNPKVSLHSTPFVGPPPKKSKLTSFSKKRLF